MVSDLKIASGVFNSQPALPMPPATTMPIRTFVAPEPADGPPAETQAISIDAVPGDPANLLAISSNPAPPAKALLVPAGNQLGILPGPPPDEGVGGLSEEGGAGEGKGRGQPAVAGGSATAGAKAGSGAARASGGSSAAGSSTADVLGGSAAGGSGTSDAQMLAMTRSSSSLASGTAVPARVMHPVNAVFDIVVQSSSSGIVPEAAGLLSNKPVYTVYIHIDQQRDWILQYCSPADVKQISRGGPNVVQLGNPAPVKAPFPLMTVTPPITSKPREEYLMVHGFLEPTGRFKELKLVRESSPRFKDLILPFLEQWEFRPGTRDGVPVRLEILLVIPPNRV
jgi:hypothetical protein